MRYAQIENAYLKELRRLRLEEAREMKKIARIINGLRREFTLKEILAALNFPKATYMYWQKRFTREDPDLAIKIEIEEIRKTNPNYGYRRLLPLLKLKGIVINKKETAAYH